MYPYKNETDREELIAHLGITEVAQMELQYNLCQFFAAIGAVATKLAYFTNYQLWGSSGY